MGHNGHYFIYDHDTNSFIEVEPSPFKWNRVALLALAAMLVVIALTWSMYSANQAPDEPEIERAVTDMQSAIDSLDVRLRGLHQQLESLAPMQLSGGGSEANVDEIRDAITTLEGRVNGYAELDSMYQSLSRSVREYDAAFREMREIGLSDALSVPLLQQRVSGLDQRVDWLWQVYWGTAIAIIIGVTGLYIALLRKGYVETGRRYKAGEAPSDS